MKFSRQEYWSGLPFLSPVDLPDPGIELRPPALQADSLPAEPPGKRQAHPVRLGQAPLPALLCGSLHWESGIGFGRSLTMEPHHERGGVGLP